uniref:IP15830p n=1 Tax=Drosophila melanogaster TaxID=7227 RepID=Q1RL03_DROME|nr:IP15830p [Drosophila melanogaster]
MTTTTSPRETTQTTFTVRKMTGRRMSKLSTVLLFCAALLLTKSCGILALSGDGLPQSQDVGQAELWSDDATTTIISPSEENSGSGGWELTTEADTTIPSEETTAGNEETTVSEEETSTDASGDVETTTAAPETSPADQESSSAPEETTSAPEETTSAPEETTSAPEESSSAPEESSSAPEETTSAPEESSSAPEESSSAPEETTSAPEESSSAPDQTSSAPNESSAPPEETSSAPEQTSSAPEETSSAPAEPESSSTSSAASPSTPAGTTIAPTPPTFKCQTAGLFPHISGDCSRYHNCLLNPVLRQLQDIELTCPELTVFSPSLGRCVRDLAECHVESFPCLSVGRFAGIDETYYYSCVASLQGGFHKFIVRCSSGQRFEPLIGGCWRYDWTQIVPGQEATEISDLAAIKRELKLYKAEAKLRLKAQKEQEKLAKKQQKLEEKAAKKAAKEQAKQQGKAEKDKAKAEAKGESIESAESAE